MHPHILKLAFGTDSSVNMRCSDRGEVRFRMFLDMSLQDVKIWGVSKNTGLRKTTQSQPAGCSFQNPCFDQTVNPGSPKPEIVRTPDAPAPPQIQKEAPTPRHPGWHF